MFRQECLCLCPLQNVLFNVRHVKAPPSCLSFDQNAFGFITSSFSYLFFRWLTVDSYNAFCQYWDQKCGLQYIHIYIYDQNILELLTQNTVASKIWQPIVWLGISNVLFVATRFCNNSAQCTDIVWQLNLFMFELNGSHVLKWSHGMNRKQRQLFECILMQTSVLKLDWARKQEKQTFCKYSTPIVAIRSYYFERVDFQKCKIINLAGKRYSSTIC